jgi:hypothetical protein
MREYYFNVRMRVSSIAIGKARDEESGSQAPALKNLNIEINDLALRLAIASRITPGFRQLLKILFYDFYLSPWLLF